MGSHVSLDRQFSPLLKSQEESENFEALSLFGYAEAKSWNDMIRDFRCVILAEAGAGKTEELRHRAGLLAREGKNSFFIRIEDIEASFYEAFEIGEAEQFQKWLQSTDEAWFFLDSVDEARLENPRKFERALRRFAKGIEGGVHRAHIYISSRPYAWRPRDDRKLLDEVLFFAAPEEAPGDIDEQSEDQGRFTIYTMRPLDKERVRRFCAKRAVNDVDRLLQEIERANLWGLAERPFDLEGILAKWAVDGVLDGRLELLRHNIDMQLRDNHNSDRAQRQPLNLERARDGARRLAAAVVLSGQAGLNVPDATAIKPGIEAESVLADWNPREVHALLERGIFNDIIYGAVRFRHRDVRELLAAEWFDKLLKAGNSRYSVEALLFRESYGEEIIAPRVRPILPWLILFDEGVRRRALELQPEIAVEGGDPSKLPLQERRKILMDIIRRIVSDEDDRSARDNSAIARIASIDLSEEALKLIYEYKNNDEAIFFLGRLVWQGGMKSCTPALLTIALDDSRGAFARRASIRAIMTCGAAEQAQSLWQQLNEAKAALPRELLAEIVDEAEPDSVCVEHLLTSLDKLPPYDRYKASGLSSSLHEFVERLPVGDDQQAITRLIEGLHGFLDRQPYIERGECQVSDVYAWLLSPATHAVERLVKARSAAALAPMALSIMLMVPALRYWRHGDFAEYKNALQTLVPGWPELNDALYWENIEQQRIRKSEKSNEPLTDDWSLSWFDRFWGFDTESLSRLLNYMRLRARLGDRLVALSTAFRVYIQAGRQAHVLSSLQDAADTDPSLQQQLKSLLNPPVSEAMGRHEEQHAKFQRKREEKQVQEKRAREVWIAELRADPDRVRNPPDLPPGEWSRDQYWLLLEIQERGLKTSRYEGADWQAIIPDFGDAVAQAYRDAAIGLWRLYMPTLQSEGDKRDNSTPYLLVFALAGLEIEAAETPTFPHHLSEPQLRHALRYITWSVGGFPSWLERMHRAFPVLVNEAVIQEVRWELENTGSDRLMSYILHDLVYSAPWLHLSIAPAILDWMEANPGRINTVRHYCLQILINGDIDPSILAALASREVEKSIDQDSISWWYAVRVDCDPENGIREVEQWFLSIDEDSAKRAAKIFIIALMGGRHVRDGGPRVGRFRTAEYLKALYILMHRYIQAKEDISHADGKVYSPGLRDDAQDARNRLFNLLSEIPGKASYTMIKQLIHEHPDPEYRPWMAKRAYKRAEEDGDLESWTAEQVSDFDKLQKITPVTHRQLFDLAVQHLRDLKSWLEQGNDSPWQTWQRADSETEMRTLIAGWLNQQCRSQYTTAQEPELANSQRMDIWLQNSSVLSPVPIELKLLDKGWSGPKLCERLKNQLVGDYLREESSGCGVMLLVSQELDSQKRWMINGKRVGLIELASALKSYWLGIAAQHPGVEAIDVIVIDVSQRGRVSSS